MVMAVKDAEEAPRSHYPMPHDHSLRRVTRSKQIRKAHGDDSGMVVIDEVSNLSFRFRLKPQASSPRFAGVRVPGAKSYYVYQQLPCDPEILILIEFHKYQ